MLLEALKWILIGVAIGAGMDLWCYIKALVDLFGNVVLAMCDYISGKERFQ